MEMKLCKDLITILLLGEFMWSYVALKTNCEKLQCQ